jgi:hypothetical protein
LLQRVDAEIAAGRAWRAREILRGALPQAGADPAVFERYGQLLLSLAEVYEAGKFLFASGARRPDYQAAIDVYVGRHRRTPRRLLEELPRRLRFDSLDACPPAVRADLAALGVRSLGRRLRAPRARGATGSWAARVFGGIVLWFFIAALVVGIVQMGRCALSPVW